MAAKGIQLDKELVEAIAQRVAELLEPPSGQSDPALIDAAELARRLGMDRSWVYSHAAKLGAVKLGEGPRARLRFDPQLASKALKRVGELPPTSPRRERSLRSRPSRSTTTLLPIKGEKASG
jgi:hypothetical protein